MRAMGRGDQELKMQNAKVKGENGLQPIKRVSLAFDLTKVSPLGEI